MLQVLIMLLLYPVFVILRMLLTAVFLFARLILAGVAEIGGEAAEKVLDSFFEDKARGKRFPLLAGVSAAVLIGGVTFLLVMMCPATGACNPVFGIYLLFGAGTFAVILGFIAGFAVWDAATEYQKRKRYEQESEKRAQEIKEYQREKWGMWKEE